MRLFNLMPCLAKRQLTSTVLHSLAVIAILFSTPLYAGNFAVSPIRVDLSSKAKSGAITIRNEAESDLNVQIALYEWTQGKEGKDSYRKSDDLVYFPRLARIGAGESRVVRIGLKQPSRSMQERQYRLYVEELPGKTESKGMSLAVAVRFGVPIFIKPVKVEAAGEITKMAMEQGQLHLWVRNSGTIHFKIASIKAESASGYSDKQSGWYLLPGAEREYRFKLPAKQCASMKQINIKVKTDLLELHDAFSVTPEMCR